MERGWFQVLALWNAMLTQDMMPMETDVEYVMMNFWAIGSAKAKEKVELLFKAKNVILNKLRVTSNLVVWLESEHDEFWANSFFRPRTLKKAFLLYFMKTFFS